MESLIVAIVVAVIVVLLMASTIKVVPQAQARIVERLGRYHRTLNAGLSFVIPIIDKTRARVDLREQVVSFPPQPVITEDN
ncbi:MAG: SPFH domain-containing protein, partial [Candidatus Nanopelagicales bacterium]